LELVAEVIPGPDAGGGGADGGEGADSDGADGDTTIDTDKPFRVVDFGCGKAYLTFALQDFFTRRGQKCDIVGVDTKADVIAADTALAEKLGCTGLRFEAKSIEEFSADDGAADNSETSAPDLVIALHACDTATDFALAYGMSRKVGAIFAAPCCQQELVAQLSAAKTTADTSTTILAPIFAHGLFRERFAALATDAIRADRLAAAGYRVTVLEFVDPEFTAKNTLIRAVRKPDRATAGITSGPTKAATDTTTGTEKTATPDALTQALGTRLTLDKLLVGAGGGGNGGFFGALGVF
jgi:SAM-dependent methyltransferase